MSQRSSIYWIKTWANNHKGTRIIKGQAPHLYKSFVDNSWGKLIVGQDGTGKGRYIFQDIDAEIMVKNAAEISPENVSVLQNACDEIKCMTNDQYDDFLRDQLDE